MSSTGSRSLGLGCLMLFLLPFAMVGISTALGAVSMAVHGDWRQAAFLGLFGITFSGVGVGGMAAAVAGRKRLARTAVLEAAHPMEPWLQREEWAANRITDSSRGTMFGAWAFAVFWNLIGVPGAVLAVMEALRSGEKALFFVLIFPLVGLILLTWAVRATLHYFKYGVSVVELAQVPAPIGRQIAGRIRTSARLQPEHGFSLMLSCVRRVTTGSGKNRSTREDIEWQDERVMPGATLEATGIAIPFFFRIPAETKPTDGSDPNDAIVWRLEVRADVPGVDYHARFEVPVFRTAESDQPLAPEEEARLRDADNPDEYRPAPTSRIVLATTRRGTEAYFPAFRAPGATLFCGLFLLGWSGVIAALIGFGAPIIFTVFFGLFELLLLALTYQLAVETTRVHADRTGLQLANGILGIDLRLRRFTREDIQDIVTDIGMRSGGRAWHDLKLVTGAKGKTTLARAIRDKREAEWIAAELKAALGLG